LNAEAVAKSRREFAAALERSMAKHGSRERTAYALAELHRLFDQCKTMHEAMLIPLMAMWSERTGGKVRCHEHLPPFGRVGFLLEHPEMRRALVIECGKRRRLVFKNGRIESKESAWDRAVQAAGYFLCHYPGPPADYDDPHGIDPVERMAEILLGLLSDQVPS
jgi:hypothetical protein